MKWYEYLIIIAAILVVIFPIFLYFYQKKKGTLKCECGKPRSECTGNCATCSELSKISKNAKKHSYTYIIPVKGMKCGMCESHINDVIRHNFKNVKVKSSYRQNQTVITSKELVDVKLASKLITDLGYEVGEITIG